LDSMSEVASEEDKTDSQLKREEAEKLLQEADGMEAATVTIQSGIVGATTRVEVKVKAEKTEACETIQGGIRGSEARAEVSDIGEANASLGGKSAPPDKAAVALASGAGFNEDGTEDENYIAPDVGLTMDEYKANREKMMANIEQYKKTGKMSFKTIGGKKFAKEKNTEEMEKVAFERTQNMVKKRAERNRALSIEADEAAGAKASEDRQTAIKHAPEKFSTDGRELTEDELKQKDFEEKRVRQERAERRRSRSRSESMEADLASPTSTAAGSKGGGAATMAVVEEEETDEQRKQREFEEKRKTKERGDQRRAKAREADKPKDVGLALFGHQGTAASKGDYSDEDEAPAGKPDAELTPEERKKKEFEETERLRQKKLKGDKRRSAARAGDAASAAEIAEAVAEAEATGGDAAVIALGEDVGFDDEALLSPNTRSRKPAALPGCVVHSVGGKFVQVPVFGNTGTVPSRRKRDNMVK